MADPAYVEYGEVRADPGTRIRRVVTKSECVADTLGVQDLLR